MSFQARFELAVQVVTVCRSTPSSAWVRTVGDWTSVNGVGIGGYVVVSAVSAGAGGARSDVAFFFERRMIPSGPHREGEGHVLLPLAGLLRDLDALKRRKDFVGGGAEVALESGAGSGRGPNC